jgi:Family of unknown function (DUF6119)
MPSEGRRGEFHPTAYGPRGDDTRAPASPLGVYAYANELPETSLPLPEPDAGTDEDRYNRKAAKAVDGLLLDKLLVFEGPDKMEICDVITRDRALVHVKQRGSSSTLSHLFAQGVNCAERLLEDPEFRGAARAVVAGADQAFADVLPDRQPEPGDRVASPNCCKSRGPSRARRRFPQVLTRRKEDLRRETHGTAVGGDRGADRPVARRRGGREPARVAV